jgi:hypothetical protein
LDASGGSILRALKQGRPVAGAFFWFQLFENRLFSGFGMKILPNCDNPS